MKIEFTRREVDNDRLILIFTGWSCGPAFHSDLELEGWDIAVVYDYDNFDFSQETIEGYNTVILFAWSLGVAAAAMVLDPEKITTAIAINGTLTPVDDNFGIPEAIFAGTANNLSQKNLEKFRRRMVGSSERYKELSPLWGGATCEISTLADSLLRFSNLDKINSGIRWKKAFLSSSDAIFPPDNMEKAWEKENVTIEKIEDYHFPDFHKIISIVIPNKNKIGRRFFEAGKTYDRQAVIQKEIAGHLAELIERYGAEQGGRVLEIGSGTGFLTRLLCPIMKPASIDLLDLSGIMPEGIPCTNRLIQADAEKWITQESTRYNAIVSSSTVQWFTNLKLFLAHCAARLENGGLLAFSTFLNGNLQELDHVRPSLVYPSVEEILNWLKPYFHISFLDTADYRLDSDNPIDLLRHLKETGVGGSAPTPDKISKLRHLRSLTYKAAFFIAIRKN